MYIHILIYPIYPNIFPSIDIYRDPDGPQERVSQCCPVSRSWRMARRMTWSVMRADKPRNGVGRVEKTMCT